MFSSYSSNGIVVLVICNLIFRCLLLSSSSAFEENNLTDERNCGCLDLENKNGDVGTLSSSSCRQDEYLVNASSSPPRVPASCGLVLAETGQHQWAVYTMAPHAKGTRVLPTGDVVIQWTDPIHGKRREMDNNQNSVRTRVVLKDFTWNGQETGGHFEGRDWVESVVPGLGMLARSSTTTRGGDPNILPLAPRVDEGGLTRFESPGAGAITHYHNYTWWFFHDVEAGEELVYSSLGKAMLNDDERFGDRTVGGAYAADLQSPPERPTLDFLKSNGYCIDNLFARKSRIKEAGRGAFASRNLPKGSIVAPVPVSIVKRDDFVDHTNNGNGNKWQLLLNYCFGHKSSSWLFFPYSTTVNLINHYNEPNVKLQWSSKTTTNSEGILTKPLDGTNVNTTDLLFELVAIRPIEEGEEIYLDYGGAWENAWWSHVNSVWRPINRHYSPSYVMDDAIRLLRTEQEQKEHPYPDNLFTSCFYRYGDRSIDELEAAKTSNTKESSSLTSYRWHLTKGLYDMKNLRPCQVLKRVEDSKKMGRSAYAVRMLNRPTLDGMDPREVIPPGELHIVTHVPRAAIRFTDRAGTTDPHLHNAFRHEIGLPDDLVPQAWRDLEEEVTTSG
jgi:SET domain